VRNFPLKGQWHFRAKIQPPSTAGGLFEDHVWLDLSGTGKVPVFDGLTNKIHLKACPVDIPPYLYEESTDLIQVKAPDMINYDEEEAGAADDEDEPVISTNRGGPQRNPPPRRTSTMETPIKEATAGISMFGKAFASSAKAAMEAVRKNVGT